MFQKVLLLAMTLGVITTGATWAQDSIANANMSQTNDFQLKAAMDLARRLAKQRVQANQVQVNPERASQSRDLDGVKIMGGTDILPM